MVATALRIGGKSDRVLPRKFAFTVQSLKSLTVPPGKDRVWVYDNRTPHLAYMLTGSGASSFYWYGKLDGAPVRHRIEGGGISIEQARNECHKLTAGRASGINFHTARKQARAETTFKAMFDWYIEHHSKVYNRTWKEDQDKYDLHLAGWGSRRFGSITTDDVSRLHAKIGAKSPGAANRVLSLVSSIYNRARIKGFNGTNPAKGIRKFTEHTRERFLQGDEIPRFFAALKKVSQDWQDVFSLCLFTGARRNNVQTMQWGELDLDAAVWVIPAEKFKTGRALTVPLDPNAVKILQRRRQAGGADYVFPGTGKKRYLAEPKKAWAKVCEAGKLDNLRIHDLRRTLGSWQAATGSSLPIIGKSLGHSQQQTTMIYARLALDPVRKSVGTAVTAMMKASRVKPRKGKP
jgi:integrase